MISDPLFVLWKAEGAPTCGATWEEEESIEILPKIVSDPLFVLWKAEGAPTCGSRWNGNYNVLPAYQRDGYVGE